MGVKAVYYITRQSVLDCRTFSPSPIVLIGMNKTMTPAARSIFVYAIYLIVALALPYLLAPQVVTGLVGMTPPDVWARVLGMSIFFLACYFIIAARHEFRPMFEASVYARLAVPGIFAVFVLLGLGAPIMIAFSIPDVAFALWTRSALKQA